MAGAKQQVRQNKTVLTRRQFKKQNASHCSTPGLQKQESCQSSPLKKYVAKHNRSYKLREYTTVLAVWNKIIKQTGGGSIQ